MTAPIAGICETAVLTDVLLKHARDAFGSQAQIARQWRDLNFTAPPDYDRAVEEYEAFAAILEGAGASIHWLPASADTTLDSIYVRDASVMSHGGVMLCHMGKWQRRHEPRLQGEALRAWGVPVAGTIDPPGQLEGGDVVWLDDRTVAVGHGYRTNADGIERYRTLLGDTIDTLIDVPLPHWRGPGDVFHLMSMLSPVAEDLAVVYSPLMPIPFRNTLLERGISLVDVPDDEFDTMGANVLALAPRRCLMVEGNPRTRARLEAAGAEVFVYSGVEISLKGGGGPTCLTRTVVQSLIPHP